MDIEEAQEFSYMQGFKEYFEVSAMDNANIENSFKSMAEHLTDLEPNDYSKSYLLTKGEEGRDETCCIF